MSANENIIMRTLIFDRIIAAHFSNMPPISQEMNEVWYSCHDTNDKRYLYSSVGLLCPLEKSPPPDAGCDWCFEYFTASSRQERIFSEDFSMLYCLKLKKLYKIRFTKNR